jgi:hypothetical protein
MNARLHLKSNYSVFLNMGDVTVYNMSGNKTEQNVVITSTEFDAMPFIKQTGPEVCDDPKCVSLKTVPLRFGTGNLSAASELDIVLVNDRSASMVQSGWTIDVADPQDEFTALNVPSGDWSAAQSFVVDGPSMDCGTIDLEAENFTTNISRGGQSFIFEDSQAGFSGPGYMRAMDDLGVENDAGYSSASPEMTYVVDIPSDGTYYVWVRGYQTGGTDDTVHVGDNGRRGRPDNDYSRRPYTECVDERRRLQDGQASFDSRSRLQPPWRLIMRRRTERLACRGSRLGPGRRLQRFRGLRIRVEPPKAGRHLDLQLSREPWRSRRRS